MPPSTTTKETWEAGFSQYRVCIGKQKIVRSYILGYFQRKVMIKFYQTQESSIFDLFCPHFQCYPFLTHLFLMHPFSAPWKHQKTVRFSDIFRDREGCIGNKWVNTDIETSSKAPSTRHKKCIIFSYFI